MRTDDWAKPDGELGRYIAEESEKTLNSYREQPKRIAEDVSVEDDTAGGGYAHRQLFELIQNSADALAPAGSDGQRTGAFLVRDGAGRIEIRLTGDCLYCADDGEPINRDGVTALMFSRLSPKRGTNQIGTFGLGFKSVLGVSDAPEFFSRTGSFRFDGNRSRERIRRVVPDAERCPVLRLPEPIDPAVYREQDEVLNELMNWAANIVRLPLKPGAHHDLHQQMRDFPPEFLLFVEHVRTLTLTVDSPEINRALELERIGDAHRLVDSGTSRPWRRFMCTHPLSPDARADRRPGDDRSEVPIWWAVPLDRLSDPGKFWAFFPTYTVSLVAGILNAPWKTNEDRQNLLSGPYNEELIDAAAAMIAEALPELATNDDPARHLDALPRRREGGDPGQADLLRNRLFSRLHECEVVPDQDGSLHARQDISYPPKDLIRGGQVETTPFERWAAYPDRPSNWLHHKALSRNRLAVIDRLFHPGGEPPKWSSSGAPRATIAEWLEALVKAGEPNDTAQASMAAVQVATLIPDEIRKADDLGEIVLTAAGVLRKPDPQSIFLPEGTPSGDGHGEILESESYVHPTLMSDRDTLSALKKLELKPPSPESCFRTVANRVLNSESSHETNDALHERFWVLSRKLTAESALTVIREFKDWEKRELWPATLQVRTLAGKWSPLHSVLLPGDIVPGDGSRDDAITVDTNFHEPDDGLLRALEVTEAPHENRNLSMEPCQLHKIRPIHAVHRAKYGIFGPRHRVAYVHCQ